MNKKKTRQSKIKGKTSKTSSKKRTSIKQQSKRKQTVKKAKKIRDYVEVFNKYEKDRINNNYLIIKQYLIQRQILYHRIQDVPFS